jgi:hypothetical protein
MIAVLDVFQAVVGLPTTAWSTFQVLLLLVDANASSNNCFSEQSTG